MNTSLANTQWGKFCVNGSIVGVELLLLTLGAMLDSKQCAQLIEKIVHHSLSNMHPVVGVNFLHCDINNNKELVLSLGLKIDSHHRIQRDYGTSCSPSSVLTIFAYNLVNHINSLVLKKDDADKGGLKVVSI